MKKNNLFNFLFFIFIITLISGVLFVLPGLMESPTVSSKGAIYTFGHFIFICFFTYFILYIMGVNKTVFAVLFPLFSIIGTCLVFFRVNYGAMLTPMIVDSVFQNNDIDIYLDLLSLELFILLGLTILGSAFIVWFRYKYIKIKRPYIHIGIVILAFICFFQLLNSRMQSNLMQHFPFTVYNNVKENYQINKEKNIQRILPDSSFLSKCNDSLTVVFIIGESLRADHLELNGYDRATNPLLLKKENLVSLPNIYSEHTHTNTSVAHILSSADSITPKKVYTETSFIALFNRAGYKSSWIANQNPTSAYMSFVNESDTIIYVQPEKSVYGYSSWLDEDILPKLDFTVKEDSEDCKLVLIQTIGSHWYYNSHYPPSFEVFTPITKSKIISQCTTKEMVNSYDNSVVYTDYVISELIEQIKDKNSILIYLSDHGEMLGEDGKWLHASDNDILRNPACIIWMSEKYIKQFPDKYTALIKNKEKHYRTDFLFHSILSAGNIKSNIIENKLNIFSSEE